MKKQYTSPKLEEIRVAEDIITTSGPEGVLNVNDPLELPEVEW